MKSALPLILAVVLGGYGTAVGDGSESSKAEYLGLVGQGGDSKSGQVIMKGPDNRAAVDLHAAMARTPEQKATMLKVAEKNSRVRAKVNSGTTVIATTPLTSEGASASMKVASASVELAPNQPVVDLPADDGLVVVAEGVVGDGQVTEALVDPVTDQTVAVMDKDSALPYRSEEVRTKEVKVS